jgi:hypothetical protein
LLVLSSHCTRNRLPSHRTTLALPSLRRASLRAMKQSGAMAYTSTLAICDPGPLFLLQIASSVEDSFLAMTGVALASSVEDSFLAMTILAASSFITPPPSPACPFPPAGSS